MTVGKDVQTALASLKGAQASFETFALATDNQNAKQLYQQAAQQTNPCMTALNLVFKKFKGKNLSTISNKL